MNCHRISGAFSRIEPYRRGFARKAALAAQSDAVQLGEMIASLMMYARPELEGEHARFWTLIRQSLALRGIAAPEKLSQTKGEFRVWEDPALVFSQTCGMPYRTRLHGHAQIVCTPDYGLDGCSAGYYRSAIIVRKGDSRRTLAAFADAPMAYNMSHSQSGFAALYARAQAAGFWFSDRTPSGSHLRAAEMVATGVADIASVDAQTWRLIHRYEPFAKELRVLEYTAATPALPYITGPRHDPQSIYDAVAEALAALDPADRAALDLRGLTRIDAADYLAVPTPPACAVD